MGELHLEIIKDRILKTYKIDADLGPLQIAYKELLTSSGTETHTTDVTVGKWLINRGYIQDIFQCFIRF